MKNIPRFHPKTKIVCTIGPASAGETVLRKMMRSGMDVARLNFSHGTHAGHAAFIGTIRELNRKYHRHIRILQDLEGFRMRVGDFTDPNGLALVKRSKVWLAQGTGVLGHDGLITFDYDGSLSDIPVGQHVYIDDGNIDLLVTKRRKGRLEAEVIVGGQLKPRKGINIPGARLKFRGLTEKDIGDIHFGMRHGVDFIAQSFIRSAADMDAVRRQISKHNNACKLIAKIENREGIRNIDEIIDVSDGIMIARGDMGVSIPIYEVPMVQKMIIKKCNSSRRFVITATQMLESMTENLRPTRAEVTDVANAILDGTDYVMLSAESASGRHPVEAVSMMNQIIKFTEKQRLDKL
ncbi:MAG: pyruvate kinase [Candidatus Omnitrophica bacterium]|nr:pyruvate kinase [Candidatus Omnitrophota bacterium]